MIRHPVATTLIMAGNLPRWRRRPVALLHLEKPKVWDRMLEALAERGGLHEQGFIDHLRADGLTATVVEGVGVECSAR